MHYRQSLRKHIARTFPAWRDYFISYKDIKKRLRLIHERGVPLEEAEFVRLLEIEIDKFNDFFTEKEEDYVIKLKILQERFANSLGVQEELIELRKDVVDFHGEIVLLENYSALNYTGLAKILKKYDKKTGALLRLPFLRRVLQQPFFTMDLLYQLLDQCQILLDCLLPTVGKSPVPSQEPAAEPDSTSTAEDVSLKLDKELEQLEQMHPESLYMKSTISALRVMKEIRSSSSTRSDLSLPPLQFTWSNRPWNGTRATEQVSE
ncbi:hypothetical protein MLD38_015311 [Melastoma candidum]|uniref:Uncharacterized protein n=1 Tax=Melastoma candidum TaxID=119954 RepID=A0ACB9RF11_9MYRT|nr:hypothetical protein MLD38_015311 [Melastoma candidum]